MAKGKSRKKTAKVRSTKAERAEAGTKKAPPMIDDRPLRPSKELAVIIGNRSTFFRRANRQVWLYVQRKGFRSRQDPRMIEIKEKAGDQPLTDLFGKTSLSMFEMSAILRGHLSA